MFSICDNLSELTCYMIYSTFQSYSSLSITQFGIALKYDIDGNMSAEAGLADSVFSVLCADFEYCEWDREALGPNVRLMTGCSTSVCREVVKKSTDGARCLHGYQVGQQEFVFEFENRNWGSHCAVGLGRKECSLRRTGRNWFSVFKNFYFSVYYAGYLSRCQFPLSKSLAFTDEIGYIYCGCDWFVDCENIGLLSLTRPSESMADDKIS